MDASLCALCERGVITLAEALARSLSPDLMKKKLQKS